tara:strand:+ start:439 stop:696 length:258 start_codon:yes stop_codon:yes gene_type:complete
MANKKKSPWDMGEYLPTKEEELAWVWCIRNNIKIAPTCKSEGAWWIEITNNNKTNRTPNVFTKTAVWRELYKYCKYYYNKYENKI